MQSPCFNVALRLLLLVALVLEASARRASAQQTATAPAQPSMAAQALPSMAAHAPRWGPVQIVVYKSARVLALYRGGNFEMQVPVVLGLQPEGRKRHAEDARTPEGLYHIVGKRRHDRWQYFLAIDYPNETDRKIYDDEVRRGRIPDEDGKPFLIGGAVGIHGNDRAVEQAAGVNWTKGCIALGVSDIAAVAAVAPVGTPVWIVE
jgi:murein L,D-transpeptidase YafK